MTPCISEIASEPNRNTVSGVIGVQTGGAAWKAVNSNSSGWKTSARCHSSGLTCGSTWVARATVTNDSGYNRKAAKAS